jgi:adenine/guanine phosphoribosyltransferase-like PRPP-binding protein
MYISFFLRAGILFQDITTLLLDPKAFRDTTDLFVERYKDKGITVVAGNVKLSRMLFVLIVLVKKNKVRIQIKI